MPRLRTAHGITTNLTCDVLTNVFHEVPPATWLLNAQIADWSSGRSEPRVRRVAAYRAAGAAAELTATEMPAHFTRCAKRPRDLCQDPLSSLPDRSAEYCEDLTDNLLIVGASRTPVSSSYKRRQPQKWETDGCRDGTRRHVMHSAEGRSKL